MGGGGRRGRAVSWPGVGEDGPGEAGRGWRDTGQSVRKGHGSPELIIHHREAGASLVQQHHYYGEVRWAGGEYRALVQLSDKMMMSG